MANSKVWHPMGHMPQAGKWVVVFNTATQIPSVVMWHECVNLQPACIWAYMDDLLDMGEYKIGK